MLKEYLENLQNTLNRGDAREESYYTHLDTLIKNYAIENNIPKVDITILPKKTEAGNPDFRIWDGNTHITGYIEAKAPSETNLDFIEESEQLKRYRSIFPNVILTNFYEFRLYRNGELIKKATIGRNIIANKLKTAPPVENEAEFYDLLATFFSFSLPYIRDSKTLAEELAKRTRFLRDEVVSIEMAEEERKGQKAIMSFYEAFTEYLIDTITKKSFADLYSQTITYGLFAARTRSDSSFNRELAFKYIPHNIGILRNIFSFISTEDAPKSMQIIVDDIAEVLEATDVNKILQDYYSEGKGQDPIVHFYETFLTAYDPSIREKRGVYYTPEPVVIYIVRAINQILKTHFDIADGLAGENVTLLDPAAGTLTFPAEAIKLAVKEYTEKYGSGGKTKLIREHILKNYYAFELMMAPYAIGHLKMSFVLEELGYHLKDDERFQLYLTNTLDMKELKISNMPFFSSLSEESHLAGNVKKEQNLLVILGNPPYSGHTANPNEWSENLVKNKMNGSQSFYQVDGEPISEKNPKWLQDDYVKFLRFAQWKIDHSGEGIVGMITNHSYLDNPTFRGMRQSLMESFNEIYILDLHGNSLKKETAPDGGKDENVFEIRQGVAIALFVKQKNKKGCKVFHSDLYGSRAKKYDWLKSNDFSQNNYKEIKPESPWYFFIPRDTEKIKDYLKWKKITEIFPINSVGIVTSRDDFAIGFDKEELRHKIFQYRNLTQPDEIIARAFNLKDKLNWKISDSRKQVKNLDNWVDYIKTIAYRPFDNRKIFYHKSVIERMRTNVMQHMHEKNLGLITTRQMDKSGNGSAFITNTLVDAHSITNAVSISYLFPLYIYPDKNDKIQLQSHSSRERESDKSLDRKPNIAPIIFEKLAAAYGQQSTPEEILYYVYAVFYSNTFRIKYAEFLKFDFPRVPFTADYNLFKKMSELGKQLVELHLLEEHNKMLDKPISKFNGEGSDKIGKIAYDTEKKRIYINNDKYFDNVSSEVWNYFIGSYQVLKKYLQERKDLNLEDSRYYGRIITAISNTIEIQNRIDYIYPEVEENLIRI